MSRWLALLLLLGGASAHGDFDHAAWTRLLQTHVYVNEDGTASAVDYAGMQRDAEALEAYLGALSGVSASAYAGWTQEAQLAFLINAYNAFTVQLVLSRYPALNSIRDLGSWWRSPWKRRFIRLLGRTVSLDDIEHGWIRGASGFAEPRIHFAVNCASVGCPALLREAFVAQQLEQQLEQATRAFLGDRSRNRLRGGRLEVSSLFQWYRQDFAAGWRDTTSLESFLALYADALALSPDAALTLAAGELPLVFLDYDWSLNVWQQ
jgi:hypothetical protein